MSVFAKWILVCPMSVVPEEILIGVISSKFVERGKVLHLEPGVLVVFWDSFAVVLNRLRSSWILVKPPGLAKRGRDVSGMDGGSRV